MKSYNETKFVYEVVDMVYDRISSSTGLCTIIGLVPKGNWTKYIVKRINRRSRTRHLMGTERHERSGSSSSESESSLEHSDSNMKHSAVTAVVA